MKWMPTVGSTIPVHLPQEIVRGEIKDYVDDDTLHAVLTVPPLSRAHNYRLKQVVRLTRRKMQPGGERWATAEVEE